MDGLTLAKICDVECQKRQQKAVERTNFLPPICGDPYGTRTHTLKPKPVAAQWVQNFVDYFVAVILRAVRRVLRWERG